MACVLGAPVAASADHADHDVAATNADAIVLQLAWDHGFQFAGYYVALHKGYYAEAGLDIELRPNTADADVVPTVLSGKATYGIGSPDLLLLRAYGSPVVALAAIFQRSPAVLLARADSGIETAADLAGRRVMLFAETVNSVHARILAQGGVTMDQIIKVPHSRNILDLVEGRVDAFDAYLSNEPYQLQQLGVEYRVLGDDPWQAAFYNDILFTLESEVRRHPARALAFRDASLRGWDYALQHPDEIIDLIIERYAPETSPEALAFEADVVRDLIQPEWVDIGHQSLNRWQAMGRDMQALGFLTPETVVSLDYGQFRFDPETVRRRLFVRRYYIAAIMAGLLLALAAGYAGGFFWRVLRRRGRALRASETLYRRLFDHAIQPMTMCHPVRDAGGQVVDFTCQNVNREFETFFGVNGVQAKGGSLVALLPDLATTDALGPLARLEPGGGTYRTDLYLGALGKYVSVSGYAIDTQRICLRIRDMTAIKYRGLAMRARLRILETLQTRHTPESLAEAIQEILMDLPFTDAAGVYLADETGPSPLLRLVCHRGLSAGFVEQIHLVPLDSEIGRLLRKGDLVVFDHHHNPPETPLEQLNKDEGLRAVVACPLMDDGSTLGCINIASRSTDRFPAPLLDLFRTLAHHVADVVCRIRAERALAESEEHLRRMAESTPDGLVVCSPPGAVLYANPPALRMIGRSIDQGGGLGTWDDWLDGALADAVRQCAGASAEDMRAVTADGFFRRSDGEPELPIELVANVIRWRGQPAIMLDMRDRSWRKRLEQEVVTASLWERENLGRELHDGAAQDVAAAVYLLKTLESAKTVSDPAVRSQLNEIRDLLAKTTAHIRLIAQGIVAPELDEPDLAVALRRLSKRLSDSYGIIGEVIEDAVAPAMDTRTRTHLYYIVREAVMNAVRHGSARHVTVRISAAQGGQGTCIAVRDDGAGFDPAQPRSGKGMGLRIMRHRAESVGATLDIQSQPGSGTTVSVVVVAARPASPHSDRSNLDV